MLTARTCWLSGVHRRTPTRERGIPVAVRVPEGGEHWCFSPRNAGWLRRRPDIFDFAAAWATRGEHAFLEGVLHRLTRRSRSQEDQSRETSLAGEGHAADIDSSCCRPRRRRVISAHRPPGRQSRQACLADHGAYPNAPPRTHPTTPGRPHQAHPPRLPRHPPWHPSRPHPPPHYTTPVCLICFLNEHFD